RHRYAARGSFASKPTRTRRACVWPRRLPSSGGGPEQRDQNENEEQEPEAAARVVSPSRAVGPRRQSADQQDDQDDQQYQVHHRRGPCSTSRAGKCLVGAENAPPAARANCYAGVLLVAADFAAARYREYDTRHIERRWRSSLNAVGSPTPPNDRTEP